MGIVGCESAAAVHFSLRRPKPDRLLGILGTGICAPAPIAPRGPIPYPVNRPQPSTPGATAAPQGERHDANRPTP